MARARDEHGRFVAGSAGSPIERAIADLRRTVLTCTALIIAAICALALMVLG